MKVWKYSLWTVTLFVVSWIICLVSALVAGKGGIKQDGSTSDSI